MGCEQPGRVTAFANPRDDAARPPTGTPAEHARTVRLASPSLRSVVRFVLIVVACGIALYLAWRVRGVIRLVAISLFLALTLMPMVDAACSKTRAPRALVILAMYVLLIATVALIGYVVAPSLVKEVQQLSHNAPRTRPSCATTPRSGTTTTATTSAPSWCVTRVGCRISSGTWQGR